MSAVSVDNNGERSIITVTVTEEMRESARSAARSETTEGRSHHAYVGKLGEICVQEWANKIGLDLHSEGWEHDAVLPDGRSVEIKTRDIAAGYGSLLVRTGTGAESVRSDVYLLVHLDSAEEFALVSGYSNRSDVQNAPENHYLPMPAYEIPFPDTRCLLGLLS